MRIPFSGSKRLRPEISNVVGDLCPLTMRQFTIDSAQQILI